MKAIFLFMSNKYATEYNDDWKTQTAGDLYSDEAKECYFYMLEKLVEQKVITDLTVFYESGFQPGKADFVKGAKNWVIPNIECMTEFIDDDTILFIRGGFKHWHDYLKSYKGKNWLMLYAANTGRQKWPWWDIVLDDLNMSNTIDALGRYQFPFVKPVNEEIFKMKLNKRVSFDVCIGASHIHDKKGQWYSVQILESFHKQFGYYPTMVMPGAMRHSTYTNQMLEKQIMQEIIMPGMLQRDALAELFNDCRVFLGMGGGGQNDRGILEAYACGLPVIYSAKQRHTPLLYHDGISTHYWPEDMSIDNKATALKEILDEKGEQSFWKTTRYGEYTSRMGFNNVVMPSLAELFTTLGGTRPSKSVQKQLVENFKYLEGEKS